MSRGRKSVDEYSREFSRLARYAQEEVSTDSNNQTRFQKGLNPGLRHELNLIDFTTFQPLVNKAIKAENGHAIFEESYKHFRVGGSSSNTDP